MSKSDHIYKGTIPYEELKYFIEPAKVNIEIPYNELGNILCNGSDVANSYTYINNVYVSLFRYMPYLKQEKKHANIECITYNSHITGYDFRFNPIDIINNIYKLLNLDYKIPFINLDSDMGMEYLKEYVRTYNADIKRRKVDVTKLNIIDEMEYNLGRICSLYQIDLESRIKDTILPKDALFYVSYKSLNMYKETNEEQYLIIPYEYFVNVSHMKTSPFPHKIYFDNYYNKYWFYDFIDDYNKVNLNPKEFEYSLTDDEVLLAWDILKPGMVEREIRDVVSRAKANPDYEKYQKLFEMKINYYMHSDYIKYIKGKYGLLGYVGFTYDNEYLLFDKFHNSETKDPSKRTILTHGEAIYALPSDKFSILGINKQRVIEEREVDDRIKKINHTSNGSFIKRLDNVVKGPNVSTSTFDEELEKQKRKMLIKN